MYDGENEREESVQCRESCALPERIPRGESGIGEKRR